MSESTEPQNVDAAELETLRKLRDELLATKHSQKARIGELESQVLQLAEARDNAEAKVRAVVVDLPLKRMASELSANVPELVLRELSGDYTFDADDHGAIVMKHKADATAVTDKDGKPIAFERNVLHDFLTGADTKEKSARQREFTTILGVRVGGRKRLPIPSRKQSTEESKSKPEFAFGLR